MHTNNHMHTNPSDTVAAVACIKRDPNDQSLTPAGAGNLFTSWCRCMPTIAATTDGAIDGNKALLKHTTLCTQSGLSKIL